jgi:hypothetical protein
MIKVKIFSRPGSKLAEAQINDWLATGELDNADILSISQSGTETAFTYTILYRDKLTEPTLLKG